MFNLSDKELDRLSREAADAYEVEKNTSSWDALERRLDQELGTAPTPNPAVPPPRRFIFPIAYTSLVVLLVSSSYFLLKSGKKSSTTDKTNYTLSNSGGKNLGGNNSSKGESAKTDTAINKNEAHAEAYKITAKQQSSDLANASPNKEKAYLDNLKSIAEKELEKKNEKALNKTEANKVSSIKRNVNAKQLATTDPNNQVNNERSNSHFAKKETAGNDIKNIAGHEALNNNVSKNAYTKHASLKEKTNFTSTSNNKVDETYSLQTAGEVDALKYAAPARTVLAGKSRSIVVSDSALLAEAIKAQGLIDLTEKNKSLTINRSLQVGISFAPDFSKVKYIYENYHIGTGFGITVGYQLPHKFSVNTGLSYANKFYQADGNDFRPQQRLGQALANEHIDFVRGSFKIIEIPLNLRYDFSSEGNTIFFVNGGLSSYFMLDQTNSYFCHDYVGYERWIKQSYGVHQSYWFSMLNLSFGFETYIKNNISLQVDPYIKLPLRGIGVGNMQLSSYGINLGIKYSPVLKRSRH